MSPDEKKTTDYTPSIYQETFLQENLFERRNKEHLHDLACPWPARDASDSEACLKPDYFKIVRQSACLSAATRSRGPWGDFRMF